MNATLPRCYADTPIDSPWHEARERFGLIAVVRVIDLQAGSDTFRPLAAEADLSDLELDGTTTFVLGADHVLERAERLAIIERFDEAWRARKRASREPDKPR